MYEIFDDQEFEWTCNAMTKYLVPHQTKWICRSGREVGFDGLTRKLLSAPLGVGSCYGIHSVYAILVIHRLDVAYGFLQPSTRELVLERLLQVRRELQECQLYSDN